MRKSLPGLTFLSAVAALTTISCATNSAQQTGFNAFLNQVAAECKPLIIGSDNFGQAIVMNGLGAVPENYNNFLGSTSALFHGTIPQAVYRSSLTAFVGSGTYNDRSFDCIIGQLPKA